MLPAEALQMSLSPEKVSALQLYRIPAFTLQNRSFWLWHENWQQLCKGVHAVMEKGRSRTSRA